MPKLNVHSIALLLLAISGPCVWAFLSILIGAYKGRPIAGDVRRGENPGLFWLIVVVSGFALIPTSFILLLASAHFLLMPFKA